MADVKRTAKVYPADCTAIGEHSVLLAKPTMNRSWEHADKFESSSFEEDVQEEESLTRHVWARVRRKLRGAVLLSLLCQELRLYGTSSFLKGQNINYKKNVEMLLQRLKARKGGDVLDLETSQPRCILHPHSTFKKSWNFVVVALLLYTALIMPYRLAFTDKDSPGWFVVERIVDSLFFVDVVLTCFTALELEDGTFLMDQKKIVLRYIRSWMLLDLVACVPFSLIGDQSDNDSVSSSGYNNMLRLVRLPRLYRLLRITRLYRLVVKGKVAETLERLQDCLEINRGMTKIFYFAISVLMSIHVSGCIWYYVAKMQSFAPDTWVTRAQLNDVPESSQYIAAIYWACFTLTTVGYGDIVGATDLERLYSMVWMSFSIGFYSFTIGSLTSILTHLNSRNNNITIKLNAADQMVREGRLSKQLKAKLRRAIRINSQKAELDTGDKQLMFDALPKKLRYEVSIAMYEGAAAKIPFFQGRSPEFISTIIPYLRYLYLDSGDYVYRLGDDSDELYLILRGRVTFVTGNDAVVFKRMLEGSYFGDVEVILRIKRLCTCCMEYDGELLVMPKAMIKYLVDDFPEVYQEMEKLAIERKSRITSGREEVEEAIAKLQEDTDLAKAFKRTRSRQIADSRGLLRAVTTVY